VAKRVKTVLLLMQSQKLARITIIVMNVIQPECASIELLRLVLMPRAEQCENMKLQITKGVELGK